MKTGFRLGKINFCINNKILSTEDFFKKKRITIFSINNDIIDKNKKLEIFDNYYDRIKKLGIHEIYCCSIRSYESLKSIFKDCNIKKLRFIPDEKGYFTKHLGMMLIKENQGIEKKVSRIFTAIITDGIIEKWWEETEILENNQKNSFYNLTSAENCINYLSGTE